MLEQQIQSIQKLASLGTMACLAAHEYRNMLVPIINYCELALSHEDDAELARKALEKTVRHGNRAAQVVESMLGMARENNSDHRCVLVRDVIESCFDCLARDLTKDGITVKLDVPDDLEVSIVPGRLEQVILNLIINARQAMLKGGGTLTIRAERPGKDGAVSIDLKDTGCGIDIEPIERIFEPFFSTKTEADRADQRGSGLGLSVCKTIIEAHGGEISVSSSPGRGTTFTIVLPQADNK